jgi:protein arginine kinase activator
VTDPTGFSLAEELLGNFQKAMPGVPEPKRERVAGGAMSCPECGFTIDDLRKVRRFGCGSCYTAFSHELAPMLRGMHKGSSHVGKVPEGLMESQSRSLRLEELRMKLEQAIASESYEIAAGLRDEINHLDVVNR